MEGDGDLDLGMESDGVVGIGRGLATGTWTWARVLGLAQGARALGFPNEGLVTSSVTRLKSGFVPAQTSVADRFLALYRHNSVP
ncbi:hypothetical protein SCHPADRAFT_948305 [Schizopora paradoxa]|uniref:Uncharacterized protein n=1 Tax=Schizopora paradoxa TaxID=27342 RepID=A0A0H2R2U8_9AGAM|nr:hypothetical protein SCHPADRAFT_948305 [Schizopora paradoxa]